MTSNPHDRQPDSDLEQDLEAVRSHWSALEKAEPPDLLDQAVLNTARRALAARRKKRPLRWLGAFATATIVVLALTIVIQQEEQLPAPVLEKADGFKLDQAAPAVGSKEQDRDALELKARDVEAAGQLMKEDDHRLDARMRQGAASPAPPDSETESRIAADEPPEESAVQEEGAAEIPGAEAWIERLLILKDTQQDEKLLEELAAFREAYPDYVLPPALRD